MNYNASRDETKSGVKGKKGSDKVSTKGSGKAWDKVLGEASDKVLGKTSGELSNKTSGMSTAKVLPVVSTKDLAKSSGKGSGKQLAKDPTKASGKGSSKVSTKGSGKGSGKQSDKDPTKASGKGSTKGSGVENMERMQIYLDHENKVKLQRLSLDTDRPMAELIREALGQYLVSRQDSLIRNIEESAGIWKDRDDIKNSVEFSASLRDNWRSEQNDGV